MLTSKKDWVVCGRGWHVGSSKLGSGGLNLDSADSYFGQ